MATIESIPSEILRHTLKIGAQSILDDKTDWHFATKMKRRNEFLLIASLVCSVWRIEAQAVLWDMLHIGSERAAQRLLQSPLLGSLPTKELTLVGRGMDVDEAADSTDGELQITAASVTTILSSMVELRMLDMFSFPGWAKLDLNLFCLESLRGMGSLPLSRLFHDAYSNLIAFTRSNFPQLMRHAFPFRERPFVEATFRSSIP